MLMANLTYEESVIRKFPNPDENNYRELIPGDIGIAVHRDKVNRFVRILNWEYDNQIEIDDNGLVQTVNAVWYLKPAIA